MDDNKKQDIIGEAVEQLYRELAPSNGIGLGFKPVGSDCDYRVEGAGSVRWFLREFTSRYDDFDYIASLGWNVDDDDPRVPVQQLAMYYAQALDEAGDWVYISLAPSRR